MSRTVSVLADPDAVAVAAAEKFVAVVGAALRARPRCVVSLSGGSTPKALYQRLAAEPFRDQVEWGRVEVIFGDERCVPADHPESNFRMAKLALLDQVRVAAVHRVLGELDPADAAARYEDDLRRLAGGDRLLQIDMQLLGMGADGHTASLFPGSPALDETTRWAVAVAGPAFDRVTLTFPILNAARSTLVLVTGAEKQAALAQAIAGAAPGSERIPLQRVRPSGSILFMIDRAAAGDLV